MPFAPLVTIVTTVAVAVATVLTVTAERDLMPYARKTPFKSIVTLHRPPSSGARCQAGQRWLTPCRACTCTEKGILRCRTLPCSPTDRSPLAADGLVIPPHLNMRARGVYMDHAFHSKKGESAEAAHKALDLSAFDSPAQESASSGGESFSASQEDADSLSEDDEMDQDDESSPRSLTGKSLESSLDYGRSPPVQQLPDPDLNVMCNYWLQNKPMARDHYFEEVDPPLAAYSTVLEFQSYGNHRRAPPVQQLPEPTVDELCQRWLGTEMSRKTSSLSQNSASLQIQRATNADTSSTNLPVHSPRRSNNNSNQPLLILRSIRKLDHSSRNMSPMPTPFYNLPSFSDLISYNPYSQLPRRSSCCSFYHDVLPSSASAQRSPFGYYPVRSAPSQPLPHLSFAAPPPTPAGPFQPPPPAPVPPPPSRAVPCSAHASKTIPPATRDLKPDILNLNNPHHSKMHPNAIWVPVRRKRSAMQDEGTADSSKDQLRFLELGSPVQYVSEYFRELRSSHNEARQPIKDVENRIMLPVARKK